ncbi:hypothetical protein COJ27_03995 [Bacillus cereus]|uniref:Uncharacterized protein n=1 Tax=Bacillus cereus TaxID=1396 RepID=A0A2A9A7Z4_BACCE|nr:hypothetical protein CN388_16255 [Bacillus cereus]PFC12409.1 hypothetical protein CN284_12825 [Bacillus cereus]PFD23505.1 hypothetical protein CN263_06925 [Bacillus cereus]PFE19576.1 hypothetical protein CN307_02560 [Bacillus cereus]PFL69320.1 hypothetical protein COJ27_03995 [Bacillus cereus]
MLYSAKTQRGRGACIFVIHKNCFYLCLLTVFVVDSFNCEFRPLLVLSKGLFIYAPYYETNIAYSETTKLYGGEEQLAIDDSAQIPICFTLIFHHVGRKEAVPPNFK